MPADRTISSAPQSGRIWRRRIAPLGALLLAVVFVLPIPASASMFGEENTTLVQMLVQALRLNYQIAEVSKFISQVVDTEGELLRDYQRVNAGISEIQSYQFESFLNDAKADLYNQYPGFAKLELASRNLSHWEDTRASSPVTAYQAITAVVGDASALLRTEITAGRANIDQELILKGEASGGFTAAHTAEKVTEKFDRDIATLDRLSRSASPAEAQQLSARASLTIAAQNSYLLRLLARTVRLSSVDATLQYASRIQTKNSAYETRELTSEFMTAAAKPPALISFSEDR